MLLLLCTTVVCAENVTIDGIAYSVNAETKQAEVVSNGWASYSGNIVIPSEVIHNDETYRVTSIGNRAFLYCSGLTSIEIPNSVTSIGEDAFSGCSGLTSFEISNSVTSIGRRAFSGCSGLTNIEIPNCVTYIGEDAFSGCSGLTSITIPNSVTNIGDEAFSGCSKLESIIVESGNPKYDSRENCNAIIETATNTLILGCKSSTIPNGITTIGRKAFSGCSGLTNIEIPNTVTSIGEDAFRYCSGLTSIEIPSSVTYIGGGAFNGTAWYNNLPDGVVYAGRVLYGYKGEMPSNTSIVVKDGTAMISERAFSYSNELVGIEIPSSVTSIGDEAFYYCSGLTSITIPNSVTSIGDEAFSGCSKLESIIVKEGNPKYDSRENCNAIIETSTNTLIFGCNNSTIPNGVVTIGDIAFYNCSGLTNITIPSSVTSIGYAAFCMCANLEFIEMPSVTYIGESAFYGTAWYNNQPDGVVYAGRVLYGYKGEMPSNTSIVVKDGTTMIATEAFSGCKGLVSIEIPNGVTRIGYDAFYDCSNLEIIEIPNSVISLAFAFYGTAWYNNQPDGVVYAGCVLYEYKGKMPENTFIVIKDGTTCIAENAFEEGCEQLIGVKIPNSVKYIEEGAFGDTGITSIEIPEGVESLGDMVFAYCYALTDVVIPSSVKSIGEYAFAYCPALTSIKSYIAKEDLFVPGNDVFYDVDKSKCTLYVPYGAKDVYASTAGWSDFLNICEFDATAIDDVQVEDTANPNLNVIYDLRGNRLTNTENLERGIYIINGQRVLIK